MESDSENRETFHVETADPGWQNTDDIFNWFDDRKDETWFVISDQIRLPDWPHRTLLRTFGMPINMPIVEIVTSGRRRGQKFKDFIACYLGVQRDRGDPTRGASGATFPLGGGLVVHIWGMLLFARNTKAKALVMWNTGSVRAAIRPLKELEAQALPEPSWWSQVLNMSPFRPADLKKLANGFPLLNRDLDVTLPRGGDQRRRVIQELWTDEKCKSFATTVDGFHPKWREIKAGNESRGFTSAQWVENLRTRTDPSLAVLFRSYSRKAADRLLSRVASEPALNPANLEPREIAYIHAAYELGIMDTYERAGVKIPSHHTLKGLYRKGKALLRQSD